MLVQKSGFHRLLLSVRLQKLYTNTWSCPGIETTVQLIFLFFSSEYSFRSSFHRNILVLVHGPCIHANTVSGTQCKLTDLYNMVLGSRVKVSFSILGYFKISTRYLPLPAKSCLVGVQKSFHSQNASLANSSPILFRWDFRALGCR